MADTVVLFIEIIIGISDKNYGVYHDMYPDTSQIHKFPLWFIFLLGGLIASKIKKTDYRSGWHWGYIEKKKNEKLTMNKLMIEKEKSYILRNFHMYKQTLSHTS